LTALIFSIQLIRPWLTGIIQRNSLGLLPVYSICRFDRRNNFQLF
jgi:hypothetical protein